MSEILKSVHVNFIKSKSLSFPNIETCLHVLSEESYELKKRMIMYLKIMDFKK